jgi:hypothetical protein
LGENVRRVGITGIVRDRPGQQLSLGVELDWTAGNLGLIDCRNHGKLFFLLAGQG